jgi:hypothetical protein
VSSRVHRRLLTILASTVLAGCATPPPPPPQPPLPPLPRSSIAAVLEHRQDLALTDEQVTRLQNLDDELARSNQAVQDELDRRKKEASQSSTTKDSSSGSDPFSSSREGGGGGMGMGGGGGRMGGGGGRHRGGSSATPATPSVQDKLDDNDTHAYLEAEGALTEEQRSKARDIASKYREQLYNRRHAKKKEGS